jgi:hypothetical protein
LKQRERGTIKVRGERRNRERKKRDGCIVNGDGKE